MDFWRKKGEVASIYILSLLVFCQSKIQATHTILSLFHLPWLTCICTISSEHPCNFNLQGLHLFQPDNCVWCPTFLVSKKLNNEKKKKSVLWHHSILGTSVISFPQAELIHPSPHTKVSNFHYFILLFLHFHCNPSDMTWRVTDNVQLPEHHGFMNY